MPNWSPFTITTDHLAPSPRALSSNEGIADRIRAAAFAELQAMHAFKWAAESFTDAPTSLKAAWKNLAKAEEKHLNWLLDRGKDLNIDFGERPVSLRLWNDLQACKTAKDFALRIASYEEKGRKAAVRFYENLLDIDPVTSNIFKKISDEEIEHIQLAKKYFQD